MPLQDLSVEILHLICEVCPTDTLQDLRLTSQKLCTVANKHLLPEVVICLEATDLRRLHEISKSSEGIRNGIKSLIVQADACAYTTDEIERFPSLQKWMNDRTEFLLQSDAELLELRRAIKSRRQTQQRRDLLNQLEHFLKETHALQDDQALAETYYAEFRRQYVSQKKLFGVPISQQTQQMPAVIVRQVIKDALSPLIKSCANISKLAINTEHAVRRNAGLTNKNFLQSLTIPHRCPGLDLLLGICEAIWPVAIESGWKVDDWSLTGIIPRSVQQATPNEVPDEELPVFLQFMQNFRKFSLCFNGANAKDEDYDRGVESQWAFYRDEFAAGCTIYWLPYMPKIEDFRLTYPVAPMVDWRVDIQVALQEKFIPHLTLLHISNFQCDTEGLERYLVLHKDTLQDLKLSDVHLRGSNWPACLTTIAGRFSCLRRAKLLAPLTSLDSEVDEEMVYYIGQYMQSSAQIEDHQNAVERYILMGEGPAPSWTVEEMVETDGEGDEEGSVMDYSEGTASEESDQDMMD